MNVVQSIELFVVPDGRPFPFLWVCFELLKLRPDFDLSFKVDTVVTLIPDLVDFETACSALRYGFVSLCSDFLNSVLSCRTCSYDDVSGQKGAVAYAARS